MPLGINNKDRIEKDRKGSDWIGSQILFQDGKRIGSDCRSIFDKRIGIGSQIQKKRIVQFSGPKYQQISGFKMFHGFLENILMLVL